MKHCNICNKTIDDRNKSGMCKSCFIINRNKSIKYRKHLSKVMKGRKITWDTMQGKTHSKKSKLKMSISATGKITSEKTKKKISKTLKKLYKNKKILTVGQRLHRHHVDLNHDNDKPSNKLVLTPSNHRKIHALGYNYLVETGQIKEYVKWFIKKFKVKKIKYDKNFIVKK